MALFPTSPSNGDQTTINGITYVYASSTNSWTRVPLAVSQVGNGNSTITFATAGGSGNVSISGTSNTVVFNPANTTFAGNLLPVSNVTYSLGTTTQRWKDLWISNSTIYLGDTTLSTNGGILTVNGNNVITATGNGSSISVAGDVTGGNITTTGTVSSTGNITSAANISGGNILATTTVSAASHIGSIVSVSGNVTGGNLISSGIVSASSYIGSVVSVIGNLNSGGLVTSGNASVGNIFAAGYYYANGAAFAGGGGGTPGGSNTYIQFNDNGVFNGTAGLTFNKTTNAVSLSGSLSAVGNITGANISTSGIVSVAGNIIAGTITTTTGSNGNLTLDPDGVGDVVLPVNTELFVLSTASSNATTNGAVVISGGVGVAGNIYSGGLISATSNVAGGNIIQGGIRVSKWTTSNTAPTNPVQGDQWYVPSNDKRYLYVNDGTSNTWVDQSQTTTFSTLAVTGAATIGSTLGVTGNITSAANIAGANLLVTTTVSAASYIGSTVSVSGALTAGVSTISAAVLNTFNLDPATANIATYGGGSASSGRGIIGWNRSAGSGEMSFIQNQNGGSPGGFIFYNWANTATNTTSTIFAIAGTTSNVTIYGNIVNGGANSTGNIGSSTGYFNTVFAKATSAQYADIAEKYSSDQPYEPGTVVVFGGEQEVTLAVNANDNSVAGVVSTNPAYLMNAGIQAAYSVEVALTGRVPTKVLGPVRKGNMMVSAGNGYAMACATPSIGTVIGKAIENFSGEQGIIEIVVGRM